MAAAEASERAVQDFSLDRNLQQQGSQWEEFPFANVTDICQQGRANLHDLCYLILHACGYEMLWLSQ